MHFYNNTFLNSYDKRIKQFECDIFIVHNRCIFIARPLLFLYFSQEVLVFGLQYYNILYTISKIKKIHYAL